MKYILFYSWQSDLPNKTNRGFIEDVIAKAIVQVQNNNTIELEISLDRDTAGVPGAPNISQTILEKIKKSDAFIADISIVTGGINDQRPSPNPNVLLELGYAIALLGWDKIILFYNEVYGKNEDLPFDIRQHRRINYKLKEEDDKKTAKSYLISRLKTGLELVLQHGKSSYDKKTPLIRTILSFNKGIETTDTHDLNLISANKIEDIEGLVESLSKSAQSINGSFDERWSDKLSTYNNKLKIFSGNMTIPYKRGLYCTDNNKDKITPISLIIANDGTSTATDIRVRIAIPPWLLVFDRYPDEAEIPKIPEVPVPMYKVSYALMKSLNRGSLFSVEPAWTGKLSALAEGAKSYGCKIQNGEIVFWAEKILHKHKYDLKNNVLYFLALPEAAKGQNSIKCRIFCSEYEDWQESDIIININ